MVGGGTPLPAPPSVAAAAGRAATSRAAALSAAPAKARCSHAAGQAAGGDGLLRGGGGGGGGGPLPKLLLLLLLLLLHRAMSVERRPRSCIAGWRHASGQRHWSGSAAAAAARGCAAPAAPSLLLLKLACRLEGCQPADSARGAGRSKRPCILRLGVAGAASAETHATWSMSESKCDSRKPRSVTTGRGPGQNARMERRGRCLRTAMAAMGNARRPACAREGNRAPLIGMPRCQPSRAWSHATAPRLPCTHRGDHGELTGSASSRCSRSADAQQRYGSPPRQQQRRGAQQQVLRGPAALCSSGTPAGPPSGAADAGRGGQAHQGPGVPVRIG